MMTDKEYWHTAQHMKPSTMKRQPTEWENIFANDMTDKQLLFEIYKQLIQLNIKQPPNQKLGRRTE